MIYKMIHWISFSCLFLCIACTQKSNKQTTENNPTVNNSVDSLQIVALLDSMNVAAANADFTRYFNFYANDATFMGTDATEYWNKENFMIWAKPYFDKKSTWDFTAIDRHIYFGTTPDIAWFDELLSTQMKICRGSGVVINKNGSWKVMQYVLSMTFPNSAIDKVIALKAQEEDSIITHIKNK